VARLADRLSVELPELVEPAPAAESA